MKLGALASAAGPLLLIHKVTSRWWGYLPWTLAGEGSKVKRSVAVPLERKCRGAFSFLQGAASQPLNGGPKRGGGEGAVQRQKPWLWAKR